MNFKPSDFFISLMEFFFIFLPGFIVAVLFKVQLLSVFQMIPADLTGNSLGAFYFVSSYILGHFLSGVSGFLLEVVQLFGRKDIILFFVKNEQIVNKAKEIMDKNFKLGKMRLQNLADSIIQIRHPESFISIRQYEADAKFFRSFIIISFLLLFFPFVLPDNGFPMFCRIVTLVLSIGLHFHWRYEAIKEASNIIVTMDSLGEFEGDTFNKRTANQAKVK